MKYYCPKCGTTEHRADEVCPKDAAPDVLVPPISSTGTPVAASFDRKKYQREYMRKYRARKK